MKIEKITIEPLKKYNYTTAPIDELNEILQNINVILNTPKTAVPLDRDMGLSQESVDMLTPLAQHQYMQDVTQAIQNYEPRAKVKRIDFKQTSEDIKNGTVRPVITLEILLND